MKKAISMLCVLAMVCSLFCTIAVVNAPLQPVSAASNENDYTFYLNADYTATISGYKGTDQHVVIPSTINGYTVTNIGYSSFYNQIGIKTVTIPNSILLIDSWAFEGCSNLTSVSLGSGVVLVNSSAFSQCNNLEKFTVNSNNTVYSAVDGVLFNKAKTEMILYPAGKKTTSYTLPGTVKTLTGDFYNCKNLQSVTIPSVKKIQSYRFIGCTNLTTISLGSGVETIDVNAFRMDYWKNNQNKISTIKVSSSNPNFTVVDGVLFNKAKTELVFYPPAKKDKVYTIPTGIKTIPPSAFSDNKNLVNVVIPKTVTSIGSSAFYNCTNLKNVIIPNSVTTIGADAFFNCDMLNNMVLSNKLKTIGSYAFASCDGLTNISVPKSVTKIVYRAFDFSTNIKDVYYGGNTTDWKSIDIEIGNENLTKAKIHYNTVILPRLLIVKQPQPAYVKLGATAKTSVQVVGEGLTYAWYYKDKGASKYSYTASFKGSTYSVPMTDARAGRIVYCKITDKYGRSVTTNKVVLDKKATITTQPKSVCVTNGKTAKVSLKAYGQGLTYKWYYKNRGQSTYTYTATFKGNTYSVAMDDARNGRIVYCVVTDKYGNKATSNKVSLDKPVAITKQPKSVGVRNGATATVKVSALGGGLTYKWYYKNKGETKYTYTASFTGNTYQTAMNDTRAGRIVYCVITDKYGNKVTTNKVALDKAVTITAQPKSASAVNGKAVKVTVKATGVGLTYKWYYKDKNASTFTYTSTFKGASYETTMNSTRNGRQVYCVITDKYGNKVTTSKASITMK